MNRTLRLLLALLAAFALFATACGSDEVGDLVNEASEAVDSAVDAVDGDEEEAMDDEEEAMDDEEEAMDDEEEAMDDEEEAMADDEEAMADDEDAMADDEVDTSVGLVYDIGGRGDLSFNDSAAEGLDRAQTELGIPFSEASPNNDGSNRAELLQLAADSNDIVIGVGFLFAGDAIATAAENPDTNFAIIDDPVLDFENGAVPFGDNIAGLTFAEEEGSFLVGAAAALTSETGEIGFIGGVCCFGLIEKFEAGYRAGALAVNPDIEIVVEYITEAPDFDGFNQPDRAQVIATTMYEDGADVIYHAAGGAGNGMFQAAADFTEDNGSKVWGIGVDSDQFNTIGAVDPDLQEFVLTSMLKRVDVAVFEVLQAQQAGNFEAGNTVYDLSVDGVGYSTTGGFVDDIVPQLEEFKAQIIAGDIVVPADATEVGG